MSPNLKKNNTTQGKTSEKNRSTTAISKKLETKVEETSSTAKPRAVSKRTSTTVPTTEITCGENFKWDSSLNICINILISCPSQFFYHPKRNKCIKKVPPKLPCKRGYEYDYVNQNCTDVNECATKGVCKKEKTVCENTPGSYKCICKKGFTLSETGACTDINECRNKSICQKGQKCKNLIGSFECVREVPCGFGYVLDPEKQECVDVDECSEEDICGPKMKCVNVRGGHLCVDEECPHGQKRNSLGVCSFCPTGFEYNNKTKECKDINECQEARGWYKGRCRAEEACINLPGTYTCKPKMVCQRGMKLGRNGTYCEDIDECLTNQFLCKESEICVNTESSYYCYTTPCAKNRKYNYIKKQCECRKGYRLSYALRCEDIDECEEQGAINLCAKNESCINLPGSYSCYLKTQCSSGQYRKTAFSRCRDIDECLTSVANCSSNQLCVNTIGSYKCVCKDGYARHNNNTCIDINECWLYTPEQNCPDERALCVNTPGSFMCKCPKGFRWLEKRKVCEDIDECEQNPHVCGYGHACKNTVGGYQCICSEGYQTYRNGKQCIDIDECQQSPKRCKNGVCINYPGGYHCQCPHGYEMNGEGFCLDIDECSKLANVCQSNVAETKKLCLNLPGAYKCLSNSCPALYTKAISKNGYACELRQDEHCPLGDRQCLKKRPYRVYYKFVNVNERDKMPKVITTVEIGHLPPGNNRINLRVKYGFNTRTREPIKLKRMFELKRSSKKPDFMEIILKKHILAPSEVSLELTAAAHHQSLYLGYSRANIYLYATSYPTLRDF